MTEFSSQGDLTRFAAVSQGTGDTAGQGTRGQPPSPAAVTAVSTEPAARSAHAETRIHHLEQSLECTRGENQEPVPLPAGIRDCHRAVNTFYYSITY